MTILHCDFESFSACELRDRGLHNYATDPTTGVDVFTINRAASGRSWQHVA